MSEDEKVQKALEDRKVKIGLLYNLLKKNDEQSWLTVKFLKLKLTQSEWDKFAEEKKLKPEIVQKCITEYDMLKKHSYKAKGEPKARKSRFEGTPVNDIGNAFVQELENFLLSKESVLKQIEEGCGYTFQPYWRNEWNAGKGKKSEGPTEAPTQ